MKIAVVLGALALAAGCSHAPPGKVGDDPEVRKVKLAAAPSVGKVALAPIDIQYDMRWSAKEAEKHPERFPIQVDRFDLQRRFAGALKAHTPLDEVTLLQRRNFEIAAEDDYLIQALAGGYGTLVTVRLKELRAEFRGRNALYWPNLFLWYCLWVPGLFVRDEDYAIKGEIEVVARDVVSERPLKTETIKVDVERSLDDFDRGFDVFGFIYLPTSLDNANWRAVNETLLPHALHGLERDLVLRAHDALAPAIRGERAEAGSALALVVDIGRYERDPAIVASPAATADGAAVAAALVEGAKVPRKNVVRLSAAVKRAPKRETIRVELAALAARARPEDTLVVYFAGAGARGPDGQCYLLPIDADPAKRVSESGISLGQLGEWLAPSKAGRVLVLLDASFSGDRRGRSFPTVAAGEAAPAAAPRGGSGAGAGGPGSARTPPPGPAARLDDLGRALTGKNGTALLMAGGPDEPAIDVLGANQGLFTHYLVRALRGAADRDRDGVPTLDELAAAVRGPVSSQALVDGVRQSPRLVQSGRPAKTAVLPTMRRAE